MTKMLSDDPCNCAACTLKKLMEAQTTTLKAIADFEAFMAEVAKVGKKLPVAEPKPEPRAASVMMRFTPEELEEARALVSYQAEDEKQASFIKAIRAFHMSLRLAQTLEEPSKPTAPKPRF